MPSEQKFLTVKELAAIVRLHPKTIYRLIEQGKLACIRIGRSVRFNLDEVKHLTEGKK